MKVITTITIDEELKRKADIILKERNQKLSTVLNSCLKKHLEENKY